MNEETNKQRSRVKLELFEHENQPEIVDFTLEITNIKRNKLSDYLASLATSLAPKTPPDEPTKG
ncbi:hypothetical protein NIES4103_68830 (plasmid) [Nostoc sp. NIES-4103]|nr:hypothetical protein NIES4103_68830 [Nostoc sp. NIES-4103]